MKNKIILCSIILIILTIDSHAQILKTYGAKVAFTSANQDFDFSPFNIETKSRNGFNFAVFAEWLDIPFFSVVTQIEYAQRGMGEEFVLTGPDSPEEIGRTAKYNRLDYLSIPLLAKFIIPMQIISPLIIIGPRFDILLGYKSDDGLNNSVYDSFKRTNFGGTIGIGGQTIDLLPVQIILELRYNFDFSDSYSTQYLKVKNSSFDIWLGVGL